MAVNETSLKQNVIFLKNTFNKAIIPAVLSILSANINVFFDGILVGNKLGSNALAAINLSLPLYLSLYIIGSFLSAGTAINAARAIGDNDSEKSQMYYRTCVVACFFVSVFITVAGLLFNKQIASFLCKDVSIRRYVREYIIIMLIGALPRIMLYIPFWYLRLDGKNAKVAIIMAVMSIGNIILDVLFVCILNMGVFGAGLASVLATTAAFIIGVFWLTSKNCFFKFKHFIFKDKAEWKIIFSQGIPSALNNLLSALRLLIINFVLMRYGGGDEVAIFTAVNGIAGFAECITLGIPQAASPMLGVFCGEQDNGSCHLLVKLQVLVGAIYSSGFIILCLSLANPIRKLYGLSQPLFVPLLWLSLSVFPAFICTVITGYYNMAGKNIWSNTLIFIRIIAMTYLGIVATTKLNLSTYLFLLFAEVSTLIIWYIATGIYHRKHSNLTRYLLMDMSLEENGNILNFSVEADPVDICSASERISEFCENNGMDTKRTMRIQLAMEEIMTLITNNNDAEELKTLSFDLRAYYLDGLTGIRIRYGGKQFNPFNNNSDDEDNMGITMLKKMVRSQYQQTFGVNNLQVTIRKA